jgi:hypothetical protein
LRDCGIYVLQYIKCLLQLRDLNKLTKEEVMKEGSLFDQCFDKNFFTASGINVARKELEKNCLAIPKWSGKRIQIPLIGLANPKSFLCYMNAALQCLMRVDESFTLYWLQQYYKNDDDEINVSICQAFNSFVTEFCTGQFCGRHGIF